ncbi:MAG TPA: 2-amino-4-hydroxy-6-hydroxymethyldihydropteridine diphosphokinase [Dehalococcoidia bacterium]|nr:2-amino-4-hydroxy-6-hydroxymethyldihydropteridine diphosphokinase [Dehalococcoidia bacterium]
MTVYIALGANLGDRRANLTAALHRLAHNAYIQAVSALYESPPQPPAPPPAYLNAACRVVTSLGPQALLAFLKDIEYDLGRRSTERWAPRLIDLDIALYDDRIVDDGDLVIPHPRLAERAFVLQPLLDLDPNLTHPLTGERLSDLLARIGPNGLVQVAPAGWQTSWHNQKL